MLRWFFHKKRQYILVVILLIFLLSLPSLSILFYSFSSLAEFQNLPFAIFLHYLKQTLFLCLGVCFFSALLGIAQALFVVFFDFKGKKFLEWALVLPFLFPPYILAYLYTDFFEYSGIFQSFLRELFGWQSKADYWFPQIRGIGGAIFVLTLSFYPYLYLIVRSAMLKQSAVLLQAGQLLGYNFWQNFYRLILPIVKKSIFLGLIVILIHCLHDFGAVEHFSVYTLSLGIFDLWLNRGNLPSAAILSSMLMVFFLFVVLLENKINPKNKKIEADNLYTGKKKEFPPYLDYIIVSICFLPVFFGFLFPVGILLFYAFSNYSSLLEIDFWVALLNTLKVATLATLITLCISFLLAYNAQKIENKKVDSLTTATVLSYALPGTVLSIGFILLNHQLDQWLNLLWGSFFGNNIGLVFSGSLITLIFAYAIKFCALSQSIFGESLTGITPSLDASGRNLGYRNFRILKNIYLPILNKEIVTVFLILFVEIVRELPLTLILRPIGFDTLAIYLYQFASDEMIEKTAVASLFILAISAIPVVLIGYSIKKNKH